MLGRSARQTKQDGDGESRQPLLGSASEIEGEEHVLFSLDDDDDDEDDSTPRERYVDEQEHTPNGRSVRFEDGVHVIAPPLRSTTQSRETGKLVRQTSDVSAPCFLWLNIPHAEYELDTEELDDETIAHLERGTPGATQRRDQRMPLLVGLLDSSAARRSIDIPLSGHGEQEDVVNGDVDLEELASKRTAGGGMVDSVANMANSILGAGRLDFTTEIRQR